MPDPVLSVVTPSFNMARYITETLDSVAALEIRHEHIVIDGGSTDETLEILAARKDPALFWLSEPDRGQTHAVNKGFGRVRGDLIAWLNADDAYVQPGVNEALAVFASEPDVDATFGFTDIVDSSGALSRQYRCRGFSWRRFLYVGGYVATPTIIFRRSLLERTGELNEAYADAADYDFYLRMFRKANVRLIPSSVVRFRIHEESKTGSNLELQLREAMDIRLGYARSPIQSALMRAIGGLVTTRERASPFWSEARGFDG